MNLLLALETSFRVLRVLCCLYHFIFLTCLVMSHDPYIAFIASTQGELALGILAL